MRPIVEAIYAIGDCVSTTSMNIITLKDMSSLKLSIKSDFLFRSCHLRLETLIPGGTGDMVYQSGQRIYVVQCV